MVGWHHRLDGLESEQTLGGGEGQRSLASCSPWGRKESDTTERLNNDIILHGACGWPVLTAPGVCLFATRRH